jgi:hypothetical protein
MTKKVLVSLSHPYLLWSVVPGAAICPTLWRGAYWDLTQMDGSKSYQIPRQSLTCQPLEPKISAQ